MTKTTASKDVAIIGGGLAGCLSALAVHASYPSIKIILLDQSSSLLSGSSCITPGRMGLGFHYLLHVETAMLYLEETIAFMRAQLCDSEGYIDEKFIIGKPDSKLRRGRYFFVNEADAIRQCTNEASRILSKLRVQLASNENFHHKIIRSQAVEGTRNTDGYALFTREQIIAAMDTLKSRYSELVAKDPLDAMVGPVDEFYRLLDIHEYASLVNTKLIDLSIETQERLLNWPIYEQHIQHQIEKLVENKSLTVLTEHDVTNVEIMKAEQLFEVSAMSNDKTIEIYAKTVVNCTWQNIEWVARSIPSTSNNTVITNRIKMICRIQLPDVLVSASSMFFGMGAHCMFSNLGDGTGLITYAPVTNAFCSQEKQLPDEWLHRLRYGLSDPEQKLYGEAIIEGVSFYIPAMKASTLLHCAVGIVKSRGNVDIYDRNSDHHSRKEHGVELVYPGFVNNAAMKLFYADSNARRTVQSLACLLKL